MKPRTRRVESPERKSSIRRRSQDRQIRNRKQHGRRGNLHRDDRLAGEVRRMGATAVQALIDGGRSLLRRKLGQRGLATRTHALLPADVLSRKQPTAPACRQGEEQRDAEDQRFGGERVHCLYSTQWRAERFSPIFFGSNFPMLRNPAGSPREPTSSLAIRGPLPGNSWQPRITQKQELGDCALMLESLPKPVKIKR